MFFELTPKRLSFAALLAFTFATPAHALLIDIGGGTTTFVNPSPIMEVEDEDTEISDIGFWFEYTPLPGFLPDDALITIVHVPSSNSVSLHAGDYSIVPPERRCGIAPDAPLPVECDITVPFPATQVLPGDPWEIVLTTIGPNLPGTHGTFGPGSIIAWGDDIGAITLSKVPEPPSVALIAIALAALGSLTWRRFASSTRRRTDSVDDVGAPAMTVW